MFHVHCTKHVWCVTAGWRDIQTNVEPIVLCVAKPPYHQWLTESCTGIPLPMLYLLKTGKALPIADIHGGGGVIWSKWPTSYCSPITDQYSPPWKPLSNRTHKNEISPHSIVLLPTTKVSQSGETKREKTDVCVERKRKGKETKTSLIDMRCAGISYSPELLL